MGESSIQWTDYTFNPWIGCRKVAPECANCYAETLDRNRYSKTLRPGTKANPVSHWGSGPRHRTKTWGDPVKWNKQAAKAQHDAIGVILEVGGGATMPPARPKVFCASLADWLDDENVPIEWFADLLKLIHDTPNLDWLLLTKRPGNWKKRLEAAWDTSAIGEVGSDHSLMVSKWLAGEAPANVWIGVSAGADQTAALAIPARVHFLSCEPMLHRVNPALLSRFDWAIFGGESGSKARPCNIAWFDEALALCRTYGVAAFVKQLGSKPFYQPDLALRDPLQWPEPNAPMKLKDSHGGDMSEWPEPIRVRQFPTVKEVRA